MEAQGGKTQEGHQRKKKTPHAQLKKRERVPSSRIGGASAATSPAAGPYKAPHSSSMPTSSRSSLGKTLKGGMKKGFQKLFFFTKRRGRSETLESAGGTGQGKALIE